MRYLLLALLLAFALPTWARAPDEQAKIDYLIQDIASLKGAVFVRNGKDYSAAEAADHLRLKLRNAGERVKTAGDFITYCASESSSSGKKYQIRFDAGKTVDSGDYLRDVLKHKPAGT